MAEATIIVGRVRLRNTNTVRTASTPPRTRANCVSAMDSRIPQEKSIAPTPGLSSIPSGSSGSSSAMRR